MAYSYVVYTGNGATTQFTVPFPYIRREHVFASIERVATTAFTWVNSNTVQFDTAPGNGDRVEIRRVTPVDQPLVDFTDGSTLVAADLDTNALQQTYINQEQDDQIQDAIFVNAQGNLDAGGRPITNVDDPTDAQDAATKAYVDTNDALKVSKAGDSMTGPLAMGTNKITGLGDPTNAQDAATKNWVETSTSAPLVQFRSIFYGAFATDQTADPYGQPPTAGDQYFNITSNVMRVWNGATWQDSSANANVLRWRKTAAGGETSLTGADDSAAVLTYTVNLEFAYLNGVLLTRGVDYTATNGTSIDGLAALTAGDVVEVLSYSSFSLVNVPGSTIQDGTISTQKFAPGAVVGASFTQAGAGAVARTVDSKLKDVVSVKDFGAVGNGVADDTTAFSNAFATGKTVYAPPGTYLLNFLNVPSNTRLIGDGSSTIIKPLTNTTRCALGADSGSSSTYIENVFIKNVRFLGDCNTAGFGEQYHLTSFNGARNLLVESCEFVGFRGDGLYLGSGNTGGQERHNIGVTIRNCLFDGVNAENRNAISVIDGDTVSIENNLFLNTTKSGMPGSIDCEPDANAFAVIRNVAIRGNRFVGGNESAIALLLQDQSFLTTPHENFLIEGNFIQKPKGFTFNGENISLTDSTIPYGVLFLRNTVKGSSTPFIVDGARGLTLQENTFEESSFAAEFGFTTGNFDCSIIGNTFYRCGQDNVAGTRGLYVRTATRLTIESNSFVDCGRADGTAGRSIEFLSGASGSNIYLRNNEFSSPTGRTNYVIFASGYTLDNGTCEDLNNKYLFTSNNDFRGQFSRVTAAPTTGTWTRGNIVYNSAPDSQGVFGWICIASGSPGTWQPISTRVPFRRFIRRNYALTENFDAATYDIFSLNIQANPALTYNAPTGGTTGQELTIQVRNISGGAMGAITWDAVFKMSGWTNPANTKSRSVTFVFDGTNWNEISQTAGDVLN